MSTRQQQTFTAEEAVKRLMQSVNRIMFYVDQNKPIPADAIEFVRTTNAQIKQNFKG